MKRSLAPLVLALVPILSSITRAASPAASPAVWLRGDTGVITDGSGNVQEWQDQSGNNHHFTQTDAARRPLPLADAFIMGEGRLHRLPDNQGGNATHNGTLAMDFIVDEPITITHVAAFDHNRDGYINTVTVRIWERNDGGTPATSGDDTEGTIRDQVTFTAAEPGVLEGCFRWKALGVPLVLAPGAYTIGGSGYTGSDYYYSSGTIAGKPVAGGLRWAGTGRYSNGTAWPNITSSYPDSYAGAANFRYQRSTVPKVTRAGLKFDGTNDGLSGPAGLNIGRPHAVFVVYERDDRNGGYVMQNTSGSHWYINTSGYWAGNNWVRNIDLPWWKPQVAAMTGNSAGSRAFSGYGDITENFSQTASNPGRLTLGGGAGLGGDPLAMRISEVLVYDRELTAGEVRETQTYLGGKYGIFEETAATPEISPLGSTGTGPVSVTLSTSTVGGQIRYTTDGSDPVAGSTPYSSSFQVPRGTQVRARTFLEGIPASGVSAQFYADAAAPDIPVAGAKMWLRGDRGVEKDPRGMVRRWRDLTGNGNDMVQEIEDKRPAAVQSFEQGGGTAIRSMNPLGSAGHVHSGTLGMDFVATEEIRITDLSAYDANGDGFTNEIRVQVWSRDDKGTPTFPSDDERGSLITEASFTPGDPGTLGKGYARTKPVTPVTLAPGSYSIVVWGYTGSNSYQNSSDGYWLEDGIRFVNQSRYIGSNGAWPTSLDSHPVKYNTAANFRFTKTAAPATTRGAIEFDGDDDGLLAAHPSFIPRAVAGDESTVYVVFDRRGPGPIVQSSGGPWWMIRDDGGYSTNWVRYRSVPAGQPVVAAMSNGLVNTRFFVNGEDWTVNSSPGVGVPGRLALGGGEGQQYAPSRNTISEVIVFDHELSEAERWRVEDYLAARYQWTRKVLPAVAISPVGNFGTGAVSVTLALDVPGAVIRYTTNGTDPTAASTAYSGAFSVPRGTEVRARAFAPGATAGLVTKAFYGESGGADDLPLAGASLWLRSDAGVELDEAGGVRRWRDLSGNGNDMLQGLQVSRPMLSTSGVANRSLNAIVVGEGDGGTTYAGTLGEDFTVTEAVEVTHLGAYDHQKDGFAGDVRVQLWTRNDAGTPMIPGDDTAGTMVAEATFTTAQPGELDGVSRFKPLASSVTLQPGNYTVYAWGYNGGNRYYEGDRSSGSSDGRFRFTATRYHSTPGAWPGTIDGQGPLDYNGAANFRVAPAAGAAPIMPSLVFDGYDDGLWGREGMNLGRPSTVLVVFQLERPEYGYLLNNGNNQWTIQRDGYYSNGWVRNEIFDTRRGYVATLSSSASGTRSYRNGDDVTVNGALTSGTPGRLAIGGGAGPSVDALPARVAEVIAFDRVLTDAERFTLESHLAERHQLYQPEAAPPVISPVPGYGSGDVTVTLATTTPGAQIRYTVDGSEPTESSPAYSVPFNVARGVTVKAASFLSGAVRSGVAESFYGDAASHPLPVTDAALWLRSDMGVVKDTQGGVMRWKDLSGNGRDMVQIAGEKRPKTVEAAFGGAVKRVVSVPYGATGGTNYSGWIGTDFMVDTPVELTHLGVFDHQSDGLAGNITVRVHRVDDKGTPAPADDTSTEVLLTQVFTPAVSGELDGGVRYLPLGTPLALAPGRYFIESSGWTGGNNYYGADIWEESTGEGISYPSVGRFGTSTSAFGGSLGADNRYLAANGFKFRRQGAVNPSYRAVRFDGLNDGMLAPEDFSATRPSTVFMVYNQLSTTQGRLLQSTTSNWLLGPHSGTQGWYADGWISQAPVKVGTRSISVAVQDVGDSRYLYNGVDVTQNANYMGQLARPAIGGGEGANNQPTNADLVELIIYNRTLTPSERQQVGNALAARYEVGEEPLVAPVVSPDGGYFANAQLVTLSHPVSGVEIRYTTDGAEPTTESSLYGAPFQISSNTTVKARAYRPGNSASAVEESNFIIEAGAPAVPQRQAMLLWLRAGVGVVSDTDGVSVWRDLSGKGSDARQDTVASRPVLDPTVIGGAPGVVFDGSNDHLRLPAGFRNLSQGLTATFVFRAGTAANWQRLMELGRGENSHNVFFGRYQNSTSFSYDVRGATQRNLGVPNGMLPSTNTVITVSQLPSGAVKVFVNGSLISEDPAFPLPFDVLRTSNFIGRSNWAVDAYYSGAISEVILYGAALSDLERETLETTVRARYGIATSATGIVTFSPSPSLLYPSGVDVVLSSLTPEARIRYTLDGSEPTESSALYSAPVNLSQSRRVRARAFADGLNASPFSEATYLVGQPPSSGDGLTGTYYDNGDFTGASLVRVDPTIDFNWNGAAPDPGIAGDSFSVRWTGKVLPRFSEDYVFHVASDDGQRMWVDLDRSGTFEPAELLINDWTAHGETERSSTPVPLQAGVLYDIRVEYFQSTGPSSAKMRWSSFSEPKAIIPQTQLFSDAEFAQTVTTPVISPGSGVHTAAVEVTVTCATPGVTIYYTTDGSVPTTNSQVYGGSFLVGVTGQVRAKAYKTGFNPSGVATVNYQIDAQPPQIGSLAWNGTAVVNGETFVRKGELSTVATDNDGLNRGEFFYRPESSANRVLIGSDTFPANGLTVPWNIATITDGTYEIIVRVYDNSGTWSEFSRTINVALAPLAAPVITAPASGVTVQESVVALQIQAEPESNVRIFRDNAFIFSGYASSSGLLNYAASLSTGTSSFKAVARNRAGDSADSNSVTVTRVREFPQLALSFPGETVMENAQLTGTVSIPASVAANVTVQVSVSKPGRFESMLPVVIPAGSTSATFQLSPRQNTVIELPAPVLVTVSATEHRSASVELTLGDDDYPDITLSLSESSVAESFGTVIGTATRAQATDRSLRIDLTNSLPSRVTVPAHVDIPAGATKVSFSVSVLDDALDNGNGTAAIGGRVLVGVTPVAVAPVVNLEVRDDEGPVLLLTMSRPLIQEGGQVSATVRRSGGDSSPALTVALSGTPAGKVGMPSTVIIPANQNSVTFTINAPVDPAESGTRPISVRASAADYTDAITSLSLTDTQLPDLAAGDVTAPATTPTEQYMAVTYRVNNQGFAPTNLPFIERVYLSRDLSFSNDDALVRQVDQTGEVAAGGGYSRSITVLTPRDTGIYYLIVVVDPPNDLPEIDDTNNTAVLVQPIQVRPAYEVTVQTAPEVVAANTPLIFTGTASKEGGAPAQFSMVNIHIRVNNTNRIISAVTNSLGQFNVTWTPLRNEGGLYTIGAAHPGSPTAPVQDTFEILTMGVDSPPGVAIYEANTATVNAILRNPNSRPLTGITFTIPVSPPAGLTITPALSATTLAAGESLVVPITVTAAAGFSGNGNFPLVVQTSEGVTMDGSISVWVELQKPVLALDPQSLAFSVLRGGSKSASFTITNTGGLATGAIQVLLPDLPWLSVASENPVPSIPPGGSASVSLVLTPGATVPLTQYTGSLALNPANGGGRNFPYQFRVVSDLRGDMGITVVDELTFFTAEAPKLQGAQVTVRDAVTAEQVAVLETGADGLANFTNLPEGWYRVDVTAFEHESFSGNYYVTAGQPNAQEIFISKQLVKYSWKVEEVDIQDVYEVKIETTFETNVPAPVVTVSPSDFDVGDLTMLGQSKTINMTIENHGFISAQHGEINFSTHPFYEFKPLVTNIGTIPAKSSMVVPVVITRVGEFDGEGGVITLANRGGRVAKSGANVPCGASGSVKYDFPCGQHLVEKVAVFVVSRVSGSCTGNGGPGGGGGYIGWLGGYYWGGGGPGGGGPGGPSGTSLSFASPDPCLDDCILKATLDCLIGYTPLGCAYALVGCGSSLYDDIGGPEGVASGDTTAGCILAIQGCMADALGPVIGGINNTLQCGLAYAVCYKKFGGAGGGAGGGGGPGGGPILNSANRAKNTEDGYFMTPEMRQLSPEMAVAWDRAEKFLKWVEFLMGGREIVLAMRLPGGQEFFSQFSQFLNGDSDGGSVINESEAAVLLALADSRDIDIPAVEKAIARWNRTIDYNARGILRIADVPAGDSTDFLDAMEFDNVSTAVSAAVAASRADGFLDPADELLRRYAVLRETLAAGSGGTCAKVKIAVSQDVMMTRTAFRATLELQNEREDELTEVGFSLRVLDGAGLPADDLFNIQVTRLTGLAAIDGTGEMPGNGLGTVQWTLIPRDTAAQEADMRYTVGGVIHYVQNGVEFNIPVQNVPITVKPDAALTLKYFHQRDVFSDDPHTDKIEPAIPYKLAVMVENSGYGEARNLKIISGQPQIVENEKGLFIDFKIIGTEVDGQPLSPSLTADFGNVAPGQRKIATWLMTSTLQGLFTDYSATFQHTSGLGDPRLSLMKNVEIHEMIRMVRAQGAGQDSAPDFLVNDVLDANDYPDTIHYSNGGTDLVTLRQTGTFTGSLAPSNLTINLNVGSFNGWSYIRLPDPANGAYRLVSATRSDGRVLPLDQNVWQTDRTFIGNGRRPTYEHILHMADDNSTGSYTLVYEQAAAADGVPPTSVVAALPADSYEDIAVTWSGTDNEGVAFYDVYVSINGGAWTPWRTHTYATGGVYSGTAGNTYAFYSIATDFSGNPEVKTPGAEATTTVSRNNLPPVLETIPNQTVNEGGVFTLRASATDPDGNNGEIRYSVGANKPGFTIDPVSGVIQWTTSEQDGGITATVTVVARDGGVPAAVANRTFTVTVVDVNDPPVISSVAPQSLEVGGVLLVDVDATDPDFPVQNISFALTAAPVGASINPQTGVVTWSPVAGQGGRSHLFTVVAADNGTPSRSAETNFAVTVTEESDKPPIFTAVPVVLWTKGQTYSLMVAATDPDGDAVTLSANLVAAAGSTFADLGAGSGRLDWNLGTVNSGVYEVPITASSNGLAVNAMVRIKVVDDNLYWNWIKDAFGDLGDSFDLSLLEMDADPDGDGIGNVHEMAFLTNPQVPDQPKVDVSLQIDDPFSIVRLVTKRRVGSQAFVDLAPEFSADLLSAWQPAPPADWTSDINPRGDDDGRPETETVEFLLYGYHPEGLPDKAFYRIQSKKRPGH
ncbi:chitobiase/beta-hexosaminidase C-terminal domain-containing protein [Luteolibacter sp. SL250]|uniref:chitobiase/beta-hexosaminidase C-terminal domain-containing protein n=1 Tax=Luteolibacter sp. SL250 TaxID=2995170 RepID=UPI002271F1AD|nr:chitobiase/beta-hexosaminidase C-terminal domain-containing protein [Luteolibacter sp. SL250]WAC18397.1 chitobiase/beta-hexosaminidase C-terminal domain-containing protein [Luteolibacter sp. SL250]